MIFEYRKFQILLNPDSAKTQGLQVGDIIRRQYFNGTDEVCSVMCVLETGDEYEDGKKRPYFIGALLETNGAPQSGELLDFVRVTNLFNVDRSGALYLTSSDNESPFMDVIDGIGKNASLSWPEGISTDYEDSQRLYVIDGNGGSLSASYTKSTSGNNRKVTITRNANKALSFEGIRQDFFQFTPSGNRVLISYKIRASKNVTLDMELGYDSQHKDGVWQEEVTDQWQYKFNVVTVEFSGRHLRSFKVSLDNLGVGDSVEISDFNIILFSSLANFDSATSARIGKLDGVVDPVYGQLEGYGAYLQKLFVSKAAHISGTLTAGDENGFGSTFYAGKIHRNCFVNSTSISFATDVVIDSGSVPNPTGVGLVYSSSNDMVLEAQTKEWITENVNQKYCFSFWAYAKKPCEITIFQNENEVKCLQLLSDETHQWRRLHASFELQNTEDDKLLLRISPKFTQSVYDKVSADDNIDDEVIFINAPQLESGSEATQYQPTDDTLNYTNEYGAWFSRGGIGGTMQNPLLQLNYDGKGSVGTRQKSIEIKQDGSGFIANKNIAWDDSGKVTFSDNVVLGWSNLDDDVKTKSVSKYVKIIGSDTFSIVGQETSDNIDSSPTSITLSLEETGMESTSEQRQWYYMYRGVFTKIEGANASSIVVKPDSPYWDNESSVTFKCVVKVEGDREYSDTFTIKKQYVVGYTVIITSSSGTTFKNGICQTDLVAKVYYQGSLVEDEERLSNFSYEWRCYDLVTNEEKQISGVLHDNVLSLDGTLSSSEMYVCDLTVDEYFSYTFPITF